MVNALIDGAAALLNQLLLAAASPTPPTRFGPMLTDASDIQRYLPDVNTTTDLFSGFTPEQRATAIRQRLARVKTDRGVLAESAKNAGFDLGVLDKIAAVETSFKKGAPFKPPLPVKGADDLSRHLKLDRGDTAKVDGEQLRTERAYNLLLQEEGKPVTKPIDLAEECKGPRTAASLLLELRCLHDVYSRFGVALRTHVETKEPVPRILALWRVEGDLSVPPSMASLKGTDVPTVAGKPAELPPGRSNFQYHLGENTPHLFTLAWLARRAFFPRESLERPEVDLTKEDVARELANVQFHLVLMGLDILYKVPLTRPLPPKPSGSVITDEEWKRRWLGMWQEEWLGLNWQHKGHPAVTAAEAAVTAYKDRGSSLVVEKERLPAAPGNQDAWVVTPREPITYTTGVVGEGVLYLGRLIKRRPFLTATAGPLPEILGYLAYHRGEDKVQAVFASAMAAARTGNSAHAKALRDSMNAAQKATRVADLTRVLDEIKRVGTEEAVTLALANWDTTLRPVVESGDTLQRIANYVMRATATEWRAYHEPTKPTDVRRNVLRYQRLFDFYTQLFSSP
jgi:hypothetical protein